MFSSLSILDFGMRFVPFRKTPVYVCDAVMEDCWQLADLHKSCFSRPWDGASFGNFLSQDTTHCIIAHPEGQGTGNAVGFVLFRTVADEAEIITLCIDPEWRGNGVGRQLMTEAILRVHGDRAKRLYLEVDETNEAATRLYKSLGMKVIATRKGYYSKPGENKPAKPGTTGNALVMELELGQAIKPARTINS